MRFRGLPALLIFAVATLYLSGALPRGTGPAAAAGPAAVAAGASHTCAVTSAGGVRCWGSNAHGQLGDGSTTARQAPVGVMTLSGGVSDVAAGSSHTCALTAGGGVKCWGANDTGQLGDGSTTEQHGPIDVTDLGSGVTAITAGVAHTCALTTAGGVKCWGYNNAGQLGDGTQEDRSAPVDVTGLTSGVIAIGAGSYHTCAVLTGGALKCWGLNEYGQTGNGTAGDGNPTTLDHYYTAPQSVTAMASGVAAVSGGEGHTCAVMESGDAKCWGLNDAGQVGDGSLSNPLVPALVSGLSTAVSEVELGPAHSCAVIDGNIAKCWGQNVDGRIGDGTTGNYRAVPTGVIGIADGAAHVSAGGNHTCAIAGTGILCWGRNASGQLGDGTAKDRSTPAHVSSEWKEPVPTVTDTPAATATPTLTPTGTPTLTTTPTPTATVDPFADTDGDGCPDARELGPDPARGGGRDPYNVWDFFDTPAAANVRDGAITAGDLARVVARFGQAGDKTADPRSMPPPAPAYHSAFDRTPPGQAPLGHPQGPNGSITTQDIAVIVSQFGDTCKLEAP